jgi:hypothetical protein
MLNLNSEVWILVLVVVLVLDQSAFFAAKRTRLSRNYLFSHSEFQTSGFSRTKDDDEYEDESPISEFMLNP